MKKYYFFIGIILCIYSCSSSKIQFNTTIKKGNEYLKQGYWFVIEDSTLNYEITQFKNGEKNGVYLFYNKDNQIRISGKYRSGIKQGKWKYYHFDNSIYKIERYKNGKLEETVSCFGVPSF